MKTCFECGEGAYCWSDQQWRCWNHLSDTEDDTEDDTDTLSLASGYIILVTKDVYSSKKEIGICRSVLLPTESIIPTEFIMTGTVE